LAAPPATAERPKRAGRGGRRVEGRRHVCRLHAGPLKDASMWTEQFRRSWEARFEVLGALLDKMHFEEHSRSRRR
ncbi:MAG: transcriptional regulator, partial [Phycisphaerales bacterium]